MDDLTIFLNKASKFLKEKSKILTGTFVSALILIIAFYFFFLSSSFNFPTNEIIKIKKGSTLTQTAELFHDKKIIKSEFWFKALTVVFGGQNGVMSGDYFFENRNNIFTVVFRVINGEQGLTPILVTIPEGATTYEISLILSKYITGFDREGFLEIARPMEGYMFPDTYYFLPNVETREVVDTMKGNFIKKVSEIYDQIDDFNKSVEDIVIMASLIEEEAKDPEARRMISGILWNRIRIDMALQVDAVFPYIMNKNTFELTLKDLKFDSPYNTYKYKGLPIGPISNPGIDSILAAIDPTPSNYVFYLSDYSGNMHYAETFAQHKLNKSKYLK